MDIGQRVIAAQDDHQMQGRLIEEYLPFIKKQVSLLQHRDVEYDDLLSVGMLAFAQSLKRYEADRGAFLLFAASCIRSRLLDEIRKSRPADIRIEEDEGPSPVDTASIAQYKIEEERRDIASEIRALDEELSGFSISFSELTRICPKQKRSRESCSQLASYVTKNPDLLRDFKARGKLPQSILMQECGASIKILEKFRKYIIAQILILSGDYLHIAAFVRGKEGRA